MGLLDDAIREHLDLKRRRGADPTEIERAEREALGPVRRGPEEPISADAEGDEALSYDQEAEYDSEGEQVAYDHNGGELPFDHAEGDWEEPFTDDEDLFADAGPERGSEFDLSQPAPGEPGYESSAEPGTANGEHGGPFDQYDDEGSEHEAPERVTPPESAMPAPEPATPAPEPVPPSPPPPVEEWDEEEPFGEEDPLAEHPSATPAPHPAHPAPSADDPDDHLGQETAEYEVEAEFGHEPAKPGEEDVLEETPEFLQDTPDHDRLWFEQRPPRDFDLDG